MSLGGIVTHYVFDFMPMLFLAAMTGIFRSCAAPRENNGRYILAGISMAATVVFTLSLCINIGNGGILIHFPHLIDTAEDLIIFWQ